MGAFVRKGLTQAGAEFAPSRRRGDVYVGRLVLYPCRRPMHRKGEISIMATMQGSATVGVYNTREAADRAVDDLVRAGYSRDQIGVVAKDSRGNVTSRTADEGEAGEGAAVGAAAGAATAGLVSLGISFGVI